MNRVVFCYSLLKTRMERKGVSKSQLSKEIDLSVKALEKILNSGLPFKIKHIKHICTSLQIRPTEIGRYFFNTKFDQNIQILTINTTEDYQQALENKDRKTESKG